MNKKIMFSIIISILLILSIWVVIADSVNRSDAANMAEIAEQYFLTNHFEEYLASINSGDVDDLICDVKFSYNYEEDYDPNSNTLHLKCVVDNFRSDKIDNYYTDTYNQTPGNILANIMGNLNKELGDKKYTYNITDIGTVCIFLSKGSDGLIVTTSENREYFYDYTPSMSIVTVEINDRTVYLETNFNDDDTPTYYTGIRECSLGHCDRSPKEGSKYCHTHSCCMDGCSNQKDPSAHCCNKHNCSHPGCGAHRYTYANSNYCQMHYDEH